MITIEYRVQYTGALSHQGDQGPWLSNGRGAETEVVRVKARNVNSGYAKALKLAQEPLRNGRRREIGAVEFWQVI